MPICKHILCYHSVVCSLTYGKTETRWRLRGFDTRIITVFLVGNSSTPEIDRTWIVDFNVQSTRLLLVLVSRKGFSFFYSGNKEVKNSSLIFRFGCVLSVEGFTEGQLSIIVRYHIIFIVLVHSFYHVEVIVSPHLRSPYLNDWMELFVIDSIFYVNTPSVTPFCLVNCILR